MNLTDRRADASRRAQLDILGTLGPDGIARKAAALAEVPEPDPASSSQLFLPHLVMPSHHDVRGEDVMLRRLRGALAAAAENGPRDFADVLLTPGVGARTVEALAMVAEVVHGTPYRFSDPARFSLAHGGKDGHPFPVPLKVYDETIRVMKSAVSQARLDNTDRLAALQRLDEQARRLERTAAGPDFESFLAREREASPGYDGRTV